MTEDQAVLRRCCRLLTMVSELHKRGYQLLRIAPGMAPSGLYWRCSITTASNILRSHGAQQVLWDGPVARYTSGDESRFFDWDEGPASTARQLADLFVARFPELVSDARGEDWSYAGWFLQMLGIAEEGHLPIAYADWPLPRDGSLPTMAVAGAGPPSRRLPLPPPGLHPGAKEDS